MVHGTRGGAPRSGLLVFGLLALGAVQACGSRSPLMESFGEGVAGDGETGGSGGSLGGGSGGDYTGGVGGDGYGGLGGRSMGYGGAYPTGSGGSSPMSAGGTYPTAGYGGVGVSVGGAYPSAGSGGKGVGVGGAMPGGGGKGMGAGGKGGGGKGDPRVYKGCFLTCQKLERACPSLAGDCVSECVLAGSLYPQCSRLLVDWLSCLNDELEPVSTCNQEDCSGDGCLTEAQASCEAYADGVSTCLTGEPTCATATSVAETTCRIQSFCGPIVYDTQCTAVDGSGRSFECRCTELDSVGVTLMEGVTVDEACYLMNEQCGFPDAR